MYHHTDRVVVQKFLSGRRNPAVREERGATAELKLVRNLVVASGIPEHACPAPFYLLGPCGLNAAADNKFPLP